MAVFYQVSKALKPKVLISWMYLGKSAPDLTLLCAALISSTVNIFLFFVIQQRSETARPRNCKKSFFLQETLEVLRRIPRILFEVLDEVRLIKIIIVIGYIRQ